MVTIQQEQRLLEPERGPIERTLSNGHGAYKCCEAALPPVSSVSAARSRGSSEVPHCGDMFIQCPDDAVLMRLKLRRAVQAIGLCAFAALLALTILVNLVPGANVDRGPLLLTGSNNDHRPKHPKFTSRQERAPRSISNEIVEESSVKAVPETDLSLPATGIAGLDDVFISVKTTKSYHESRLDVIIKTWFTLARKQTWFFTDAEDPVYQEKTVEEDTGAGVESYVRTHGPSCEHVAWERAGQEVDFLDPGVARLDLFALLRQRPVPPYDFAVWVVIRTGMLLFVLIGVSNCLPGLIYFLSPHHRLSTGGHMINTKCQPSHNRKALCCKMSVEFDTFLDSGKK
ncbi:unnamed protein product [Notodromas monacha]|uniref:Fringe-like glycosyltransferase domain-containing protein n=1 Tax=Notodromas monacha TaxID=399045 RepID=A0A7R9BFZ5_9CRUS|nr:unnamed protein product [Notodromas monacha]CAG0914758.1 unnamed protein product [Notodromas monacha]